MKNKYVSLFFLPFLLFSCQKNIDMEKENVRITFLDNDKIDMSQKSYHILKGRNLKVSFTIEAGYTFKSCSYINYQIQKENENQIELTLVDVQYPQRISIDVTSKDYTIEYHLNGGSFLNESNPFSSFVRYYDFSHHRRANTEQGYHFIHKKGYVLKGWNTKEDGSGTHIGLGSKVSIEKGKVLNLYASWEKETPISDFEYTKIDNDIVLKRYIGDTNIKKLVIPEEIDSLKVRAIDKGFASSLSLDHLFLPSNLKAIKSYAFVSTDIKEITLADSLDEINANSFDKRTIKTWHINANTPPKTINSNDTSIFSEDMDNLILTQGKKRLVLFGGCSMGYGIDSTLFKFHFQDYEICNMGVIGGSTARSQIDIISHYLSKGDIFLHAPEVCSQFQLMSDDTSEPRMFELVEGNYDLLSFCDMSVFPKAFDDFFVYLNVRKKWKIDSYEDYNPHFNQYGDYIVYREFQGENKSHNEYQYVYDPTMVNEESMALLYNKYKAILDKGCEVLFSYSPVNQDGLSQKDREEFIWSKFSENIDTYLAKPYGIPVISKVENYLMEGKYFYDTDYHLTSEGAIKRSKMLIEDIKNYNKEKI